MRPIFFVCVCVMFFIKSKSEKIITYNSLCIILRNLAKIIILKNMKIWHWHGMDHAQLVTIEYSEFGIYLHISNIGFTNDVRMTMICKKKLHYIILLSCIITDVNVLCSFMVNLIGRIFGIVLAMKWSSFFTNVLNSNRKSSS